MLTYSKLNLLLGCFNQYVFSDAKMNIDLVKMYFDQDSFSKNNSLVKKLIQIIDQYDFSSITEPLFVSAFQSDGKSDEEIKDLISRIKEYKSFDKSQSSVFRSDLKEVCYQAVVSRAKYLHNDDVVGFTEELRKFYYKSNVSNYLTLKNYKDLDITDLAKSYSGEGYKSAFRFINNSYTCGGYIPGQIVNVVGAPGCGKSLFIQNEVVNFIKQGRRVHMLILGDLNEADIASRLTCMMARKPRRVIESDVSGYYLSYRDKFSDLLSMTIVPAGVVTSREYVDWMLGMIDDFDVLVVDYDANHKRDRAQSMYDEFGVMYDSYTELSRAGKLVFVATQPKLSYYREEELPMEALSDSSKKQQVVDMIITIGRNYNSKMRMGKLSIVKSRRGELGQAYWIGTNEGLFYESTSVLYARYRNQDTYVGLFSYDELTNQDVLAETFSDVLNESDSTVNNVG